MYKCAYVTYKCTNIQTNVRNTTQQPRNLNSNMPSPSPRKVVFMHIDECAGTQASGFQKPPPFWSPQISAQRALPRRFPGPQR